MANFISTLGDIATVYGAVASLTGSGSGTASTISTMSSATYPVNTTMDSASSAFNWVQTYIKPSMFATPDSVLVGFLNSPIKSTSIGSSVPLLGMCESLSLNLGISVVSLKELRNEHNIIIPTKAQPGTMTISRLLGYGPNFARSMGNYTDCFWRLNAQDVESKQLFGIIIAYMSADRTQTISTVYAERCAIQNMSMSASAGQSVLYENVTIIFDKLVDGKSTTNATTAATGKQSTVQSILNAATIINDVKATVTAAKSVNNISSLYKAVNYAENLDKAINNSGLFGDTKK